MHAPGEETGWEQLFWLLFERTSNPIALLDDQRRIVEVNEAGRSLFGGDRQALVGTSLADMIEPAERPAAASEWEEFLSSGEYSGTRTYAARGQRGPPARLNAPATSPWRRPGF